MLLKHSFARNVREQILMIARKYRQIIVIAIACVAVAAYVVPFNWGSVTEIQAQYEVIDSLNEAEQTIGDGRLGGIFDIARERILEEEEEDEAGESQEQSGSDELNTASIEESDNSGDNEANSNEANSNEANSNEANSNDEEDNSGDNEANSNDEEDNSGDNDGSNAGDEARNRVNELGESLRN